MDTFQKVLGILGLIFVVIGAAAFVWAYYMASLNKNQLEALRGDRDDLDKRVKRLEEELTKSESEKELLKTEVKILRGIVTHDTKMNELMAALARHDENVEQKYTDYMAVTGTVLETTERVLSLMEQIQRRNNA